MKLSIKEIDEGAVIPKKFTCEGADYSPEVYWSEIPPNTKSIVLIVDDPDAPGGTFVHWVVYNIPPNVNSIQENFPKVKKMSNGITQGKNDFGKIGYNGPCPPRGHGYHRYYFTLYAVTNENIPKEGLSKQDVLEIIRDKIIAKETRMGKYERT